ncbi:hypothetical protein A2697_03540 [Candidatus Curtissbacteria bacterium RIFCSPHIGHO2_01_FULL_41_44]|uniref:Uncharacterized protein n=1 Tax=Candidatus Curtissbacteria bacterium RIFCSPLOWO2_01_FULL_42_50 TaxID=1797730 RepID=A0A1F5H7R1_9BACT|nr:MAG: hypothetical protein A2697_03540 [Candidatus Curtissbacteria bacterium RIFCSPHIGHO2_01_FULL_41_44]OGD94239.1 MAG: hypothetical protein A3C33_02695 [Candidatus Curtissbacteria bacterium RIFCSPHIGHO2_02_FULL_42_58]OGD97713.1 MAG: hypothetical protein A3E71_03205 [Candidatus Curtissbacteria bacterium RIFCSPHIGHO2_12_FULL_42_33]OGE00106.1 MAG: hypothetical protein A3B54_01755 [Candidatus Curtissbacteria bacterium RIFCSPLOWO2_01_FULL_42_50]OGE02031.1 MAG: hypothetical protein A3G16_00060 [Ca
MAERELTGSNVPERSENLALVDGEITEFVIYNRITGGVTGYGFGREDCASYRKERSLQDLADSMDSSDFYFKTARKIKGTVLVDGRRVRVESDYFGLSGKYYVDGIMGKVMLEGKERLVVFTSVLYRVAADFVNESEEIKILHSKRWNNEFRQRIVEEVRSRDDFLSLEEEYSS